MQFLQSAHTYPALGGDRILKQRVLSWLQSGQPQDAACTHAKVEDDVPGSSVDAGGDQGYNGTAWWPNSSSRCQKAAQMAYSMSPTVAARGPPSIGVRCRVPQPSQDTPAYKRATALWKKWKSALLPIKGPEKLNAKVLSKHQRLLRPSVDSSSFDLPYAATPPEVAPATPPSRPQNSSLSGCQLPGAYAAAAGLPSGVELAYHSRLYTITPRSSAPVTPKALGCSAAPATNTGHGSGSWNSTAPAAAAAATAAAPAAPAGSDSPRSAEDASSGYARLWTETSTGSATGSSYGLASPHTPVAAVAGLPGLQHVSSGSTTITTATGVATPAAGMCRSSSQPIQPIVESEVVVAQPSQAGPRFSAAAAAEVATLHRTLCGTAMTAYPAVAAVLQQPELGLTSAWADRNPSANRGGKPAAAAADRTGNVNTMASSPRLAAAAGVRQPQGAPWSSPGPSSPVSGAALQTIRETAEVSRWLLRAALLEDELQGRALEVQEQLDQLADRKEEVKALLLSMTGARGGATTGSAAVMDSSWAADRVDAMRQQLTQEMCSITAAIAQLAARAARLGSGLACLQGCQTVMHGSKGARLTPASKLAVLQLVLGDVVARLSGEGLHQLAVCQGLPGLELEEQLATEQLPVQAVRCSMAGSFNRSNPTDILTEAGSAMPAPLPVLAEVVEDENGYTTLVAVDSVPSLQSEPAVPQFEKLLPSAHQSEHNMPLQLPSDPAASSTAFVWQQQQQQWRPQYLQRECDSVGMWSSDDDEDDEVIVTLSSVLSLKHYTPRPSLAYESRRSSNASASVAASMTASVAASAIVASVDHAHTTAAVKPVEALGTRHGSYWAAFNEQSRGDGTRNSVSRLLLGQQRAVPAVAASAAAAHSSSSLYSSSRSSLPGLPAQQQLLQATWHQSTDAAIAAAAVAAEAVSEASSASIMQKASDAAARVSAAWPTGGVGEGGDCTDMACLAQVLVQQPLADVPEECESDASWHSAAESLLGSVRSSIDSSACITAVSHAADLAQALALHSSSSAVVAPGQLALAAPTHPAVAALEAALGAHVPGIRWPAAAAAALPRQSVAPLPRQSVAMAPMAEYESAPVQQLLSDSGAAAVDISGMTVGQLLQSLTLAVVKQRQSVAL